MDFTARSDGSAVAALPVYDVFGYRLLRVIAHEIGSARVTVVAHDAYGHADSLSFVVTVVDDCPSPPPADYVDYFPLWVGRDVAYDYEWDEFIAGIGHTWRTGILRREIVNVADCLRGTITYTVLQTIEGSSRFENDYTGEVRESALSDTSTVFFNLTDGVNSLAFIRRMPDFVVPRWLASTSPDTVDFGHPFQSVHVRLVRDEGPVYWHEWEHLGAGADRHTYLRRRRSQ